MAYVITDLCTKCMACTKICPVECIHPTESELSKVDVPQVYINPLECIDCGACAGVCPVSAIFSIDDLPKDKQKFSAVNAQFFNAKV